MADGGIFDKPIDPRRGGKLQKRLRGKKVKKKKKNEEPKRSDFSSFDRGMSPS